MNKRALFFIFLSVFAGLNVGTVRHTEDPIRDTQTNPILYEQKKEEEKDGKKGPLMYHVKNNPKESFFIDSPLEKEKKSSSKVIATEETSPATTDTSSWWEEQPTASQSASSAETVSEPLPEPEKLSDPDATEPTMAPATSEAGTSTPGSKDDSWW